MFCWKCGKELKLEKIYRTTDCPFCNASLHSCKGCKFYSTSSHYECRESITDLVSDKETANFCEYFSAGEKQGSTDNFRAQAAKAAFNSLFGD